MTLKSRWLNACGRLRVLRLPFIFYSSVGGLMSTWVPVMQVGYAWVNDTNTLGPAHI